jgi:2,5-diamino-6-(ribosylamino)-4(3H)-pyrimidinone 5'-phosphate reductase
LITLKFPCSFLTSFPVFEKRDQWVEITGRAKTVQMRPYVIVNIAMSADGKISTRERRQVRISGAQDFARVDRLKAACDAVMVGIGTVLADDPSLTIKSEECRRYRRKQGWDDHPVRIVIDSSGRISPEASILNKGEGKRVVVVSKRADASTISLLERKATLIVAGEDEVDLQVLMNELGAMGIHRVLVEGGGTLIAGLIKEGLVNEIYTFIGNIIIGGKDAPTFSDGEGFILESAFPRLSLQEARRIEQGILLHWIVENTYHDSD